MAQNMELKSPELLPTGKHDRDLGFMSFTFLWAGMAIELAGFMTAAQLYPGLAPTSILLGVGIGLLIVTLLLVLIGDIGTSYGVPFIVYMRACFGYKGAQIPGVLRVFPCMFWFGFQTFIAANALNVIMEILTGYSNVTLLIILFGAVQILNAAYGLKAMAKFDWIAVPLLVILFAVSIMWLFNVNNTNFLNILASPSDNSIPLSIALLATAGGWITMALNSSDLTRKLKNNGESSDLGFFTRNRTAIFGQIIGLVLIGLMIGVVGMTFGVVTGYWDPVEIMTQVFGSANLLILIPAFLVIAFSQWSTNTAVNLMPPAYILINLFPKLNFAKGVIIAGILGLILMPWKFGAYLVAFQVFSSGLLGPIAGIMIADYYFIRKMKLNVKDLYEEGGQYTYKNNYNPAAIWTLALSSIAGFFMNDYAFFVSFGLSLIFYVVFMKTMVLNKYEQNIGKVILMDSEDQVELLESKEKLEPVMIKKTF
jgi:nucleobase:cation symporter-1, NCS1 family